MLACALALMGVSACAHRTPPPPDPTDTTNPIAVSMGTVTGTVPLCIGPALPPGTNPVYRADLRVTASDGTARIVKVTTHYHPDRFSIRLPTGSYRIHDLAQGFQLPDNQVAVRAGAISHVDLGFMGCISPACRPAGPVEVKGHPARA